MENSMRVVSGTSRGRRLEAPEGFDVRPTTDKVKESMFNIIQFELCDAHVLDLFAGSGQLGIEALSRGASSATLVDSSRRSLEYIRKNVEATGFSGPARIVASDSFAFLRSTSSLFDIVILDPPYEKKLCDKAFEILPRVLKDNSVVICETRTNESLPDTVGNLHLEREYNYSSIKLSVYRSGSDEV